MNDLEARLLAAHARCDTVALVGLYTEAGDQPNSEVAQGFYLTQAYVYALELGDPRAAGLHAQLVTMGREA